MGLVEGVDRKSDLSSIRLPRWRRVEPSRGVMPWLVVDPDYVPVEPVRQFLRDLTVQGARPVSVRLRH